MSPTFVQANTNGRLHAATEPSLPPLNRGFLYGDAIYEVWRTYHSVVFAWEEHWRRLQASAAALYITIPWSPAEIAEQIRRTVAAHRAATGWTGEEYIRLQITRGAGAIGLDTTLADQTDFVLLVQPCPQLTPEKLASGYQLSIAQSLRRNPAAALDPAWKTGNYLNNLLALREARSRGADEVVLLNLAGEITEAAVCNLAFLRGRAVVTPPVSAGILIGITRGLLQSSVAAAAGFEFREETIRPERLGDFSECFLLSSTRDIAPVAAIDEHRFQLGPDSGALRLKAAFADYARAYAGAHPQQRVDG
jgi:branched-chain amino acid aminotransferase